MLCSCGCKVSVCDYEGNEQCKKCGHKGKKLIAFIDSTDYEICGSRVFSPQTFLDRVDCLGYN